MKFYKKDRSVIALSVEEEAPTGYVEITEEQYNTFNSIVAQLAEKYFALKKTDYQALKFAEGWISAEDYAPIKAARQALRNEINELEEELGE